MQRLHFKWLEPSVPQLIYNIIKGLTNVNPYNYFILLCPFLLFLPESILAIYFSKGEDIQGRNPIFSTILFPNNVICNIMNYSAIITLEIHYI